MPTALEALQRLRLGNERFVKELRDQSPAPGRPRPRTLPAGQVSFAVILGCADSRVPPEHVFDEGRGDLFVVRVAGNTVSSESLASVEFAALAERIETDGLRIVGAEYSVGTGEVTFLK